MIERIVSGGQTGADQAALRAAKACGIPTGGWAPRGWLTEDGPAPWLGTDCGLAETRSPSYPERARLNVEYSDGTLWFGDIESRGYRCTHDAALARFKPFLIVYAGRTTPGEVLAWVEARNIRILNIAGNRASKAPPDFGDRVERFMRRVLGASRA